MAQKRAVATNIDKVKLQRVVRCMHQSLRELELSTHPKNSKGRTAGLGPTHKDVAQLRSVLDTRTMELQKLHGIEVHTSKKPEQKSGAIRPM